MRVKTLFIIILILCLPLSACGSSSITITLLDSETKEPIEGAVAIAFWNQTKGLGLTYTETVKIVEAVSNKDGKFTIPAVSVSIFADKPHLKVYKAGYVGWYNKEIYEGHYGDDISTIKSTTRNNFRWRDQELHLEKFRTEYSYNSHLSFLRTPFPRGDNLSEIGLSGLFRKALEREAPLASIELTNYKKERQGFSKKGQ